MVWGQNTLVRFWCTIRVCMYVFRYRYLLLFPGRERASSIRAITSFAKTTSAIIDEIRKRDPNAACKKRKNGNENAAISNSAAYIRFTNKKKKGDRPGREICVVFEIYEFTRDVDNRQTRCNGYATGRKAERNRAIRNNVLQENKNEHEFDAYPKG